MSKGWWESCTSVSFVSRRISAQSTLDMTKTRIHGYRSSVTSRVTRMTSAYTHVYVDSVLHPYVQQRITGWEGAMCKSPSSPKWPFTLATFILVLSKNVQFCQWLRFTTLKTDQTSSLAAATPWHETVHCRLDLNLFSSSRWKMMTTAAIVNCQSILDYP